MPWVIDTSLLIDVAESDPTFGEASAALLEEKLGEGLVVSPVTAVELAPVFEGDMESQEEFLEGVGVEEYGGWTRRDTEIAFAAWSRYVHARRARRTHRRPVADILIGAFAERHGGLLTRNPDDFRPWFSQLPIVVPQGGR